MKMINFKKSLFILVLVFLNTVIVFNAYSRDVDEAIGNSIKSYDRGEYSESVRILEEYILKELYRGRGINANVMYNLGSSYYKNGNKGKAMGAYLMARSLNPLDKDIKYNINFIKESLTDSLEVESLSTKDVVFFWNFFLNQKQSLYIVVVIFSLLEVCLFLYLINFRKRLMKNLCICLGIVWCVFLSGFYVKMNSYPWTATISDDVSVYSGPSNENSVLFNLHEAAPVMIEEGLDGWKKIKLSDGKTGWLKANEVWELFEGRG